MFKNLKLKIASRRVKKAEIKAELKKARSEKKSKTESKRGVLGVITWPFRAIKKAFQNFWAWIRTVDLIGMVNLTMLIAIIVLFSMLILNVLNYRKKSEPVIVNQTSQTSVQTSNVVNTNVPDAPIAIRKANYDLEAPRKVVKIIVRKQPVRVLQGDVVIDGAFPGERLGSHTVIKGNLYLQNMRKYTLPCKIYIDGDLFLRNVDMLRFAGDFVVTGNIYVSHNSSFGPIPKTARLGGQVIF